MKIDSAKSRLKKSHTEPPADCADLIRTLVGLKDDELLETLTNITTWTVGKCELYHWVSVLDKFDEILGKACSTVEGHTWYYRVDEDTKIRDLVLGILNFTALLIEYSCSRHIYNSIDHVISLMCVADLDVTHAVLNLLYTFTKRSTYLTRLNQDTRKRLISQLTYLADSWGGKENGYGLADCCGESDNRQKSATTLHFDFRIEEDHKNEQNQVESKIESIYIQNISKFSAPLGKIMEELLDMYSRLPKNLHMKLYTQLRLAHSFGNSADRLKCVQVRLHAISVLVFMSSSESAMSPVLYPGFVEEIVDLLQLDSTNDKKIIEIKAAALRTITSIVHLDHPPRLVTIIDATGSGEYHGLLPKLIRECIDSMTSKEAVDQTARFPHSLSTALFSFLYHLSSYESGAEALVNSGMVESLLTVIQKIGDQQDQIMFVTRAVRIVDLVTNVEMTSFSGLKGVQIFIDRLEREVASCRIEAPRELEPRKKSADGTMEIDENIQEFNKKGVQCMPQRSALFKSILNFLKKTIQDQTMAESIRHIMESTLPKSLRHIISNCDYYGASLFLVALEVIQFYVFHEPSLLSNMQETGITDVILQALLVKGPPATKEVLQFLPAIFTAMCMNEAGLNEFQSYNPFEKMFKVLINIDYLQAMKKRRSSESGTDTAGTLGSSVDELMRHQNSLRKPAIAAAIDLLHYLVDLGNDPNTIIVKSIASSSKDAPEEATEPATVDQETQSDEEQVTMDEELPQVRTDQSDENPRKKRRTEATDDKKKLPEKVPLLEYIVNVCKFLDSMLSNNNTPDHCKEFISAGGVQVLLKLVSLKSLPLDFPTSQAAQQVASVLRVVFVLSKDRSVLKASIDVVKEWLDKYETYWQEQSSKTCIESPSMMLREYTDSTLDPSTASIEMPIFELTSKIFGFVNLLQNMTNNVQNEARVICVKVWSSEVGMKVLDGFAKLYRNLIWESSCMIEIMEDKMEIEGLGKDDLDRIVITECPNDPKQIASASTSSASSSATTPTDMNGASPTTVLQDEVGSLNIGSPSEQNRPPKRTSPEPQVEEQKNERLLKKDKTMKIRKMIRDVPYQAAQDLGVKLSTLFQLLVKFATAPARTNRRNPTKVPPSTSARIIAAELIKHIMDTLVWKPPIQVSSTKFRLFFGRSATQLLTALLLDECKVPYMLMLQHLDAVDGLRKMEDALYSSIEDAAGVPLETLLEQEALPRGVGEHLSEWLTLIEKLVDTRKYDSKPNDRSYVDMPDTYAPYHVPFHRASFMAHVHKIAFRAIKLLWGKKCLSSFGTKKESSRLLENILTVLRHIIKSEDYIDEALTVEKESGDINASNRNKMIQAFFVNESEADCKRHSAFSPRFSQIIQQLVAGENLQELLDEFMWLGPYEFIDRLFRNQDPEADLNDIHRAVDSMLGDDPLMLLQPRVRSSQMPSRHIRRGQTTSNSLRSSLASLSSNLERIAAELENPANRETDSDAQLASNVETLVSMGYSNELAGRALAQTRNNLTEAIEFCLTAPPLEEDDELAMAIRLSLGEPEESPSPAVPQLELHPEDEPPVNLVEPSPPREVTPIDKLKKLNSENIARFAALLACGEFMKTLERKESPYIDPADVLGFSENMTSGCFQMLEDDPKAVYSVSDLLIATMRLSDKSWTQHAITEIVSKIKITAKDVLEKQNCLQKNVEKSSDPNFSKGLLTSLRDSGFDPGQLRKASQDLSTGLLLLTLLFDEAKMNCAKAIDSSNLMDTIVELLTMAKGLIDGAFEEVPKWVSSSLLLADLYQKISLADERQKQLDLIYANQKVTWKYYEEREKRWKSYTDDENNKISKAFEKGESSCRVGGRRKYFICFNRMIQQSDENPNRKPIMRFFEKKKDEKANNESQKDTSEEPILSSMKLTDDQAKHLIECCVTLCTRRNTDSDTIHSSLRIVLRVTKKHAMALYFAEKGGLDMLFQLTHNQGFSGFYSVASLLIRHLLESPVILKACFRKTVSTFASASNAQQTLGVHDRSSSSRQSFREINLMLRQLSPVACRDPDLFIEVVQKQLKINIRNYHGGKDISNVSADTPRDAFLNTKDNEKENMRKCPAAELSNILQILIDKLGHFSDIADKDMEDEPPKPTPLLSQSLLLRILAEIVGSYPACASALCKLKISGSESNLMEFIIDRLLLQKGETTPDNLCLNLLACFAACDHAKVKNLFIAELKNGLARIVKQPESSQKHHHLRAIVELVLVAIKRNSPPQKEDSLRSVVRSLPDKDINSLSITMVKRGVAQDLARTIHTLDLSSPHLSLTLNIIFRALETLSKVTGIAINIKSDANAKKSKSGAASTSASARSESPEMRLPSVQAARDLEQRFPELMAAEREMRQQANEALMGIIAAEEQIQESRRRRQILIDAMPPPANPDRILEQDTDQGSNMEYEDEQSQEESIVAETDTEDLPELQDLYQADANMHDDHAEEEDEDDDEGEDVDDDEDEDDDDDEQGHGQNYTENDFLLPEGVGMDERPTDEIEEDMNRSDDEEEDDDDEESIEFPLPGEAGHYEGEAYEILDPFNHRDMIPGIVPMDLMPRRGIERLMARDNLENFTDTFAQPWGRGREHVPFSRSFLRRRELRTRGASSTSNAQPPPADNSSRNLLQPLNPTHPLLSRVGTGNNSSSAPRTNSSAVRDYVLQYSGRNWESYQSYPYYFHRHRLRPHNMYNSPASFFGRDLTRTAQNPNAFSSTQMNMGDLLPDHTCIVRTSRYSQDERLNDTEVIFPSAFYRWAEAATVLDGESIHNVVLIVRNDIMPVLEERCKKDLEEAEKARKAKEEERKKAEAAKKKEEAEKKLKEEAEKKAKEEAEKAEAAKTERRENSAETEEGTSEAKSKDEPTTEPPSTSTGPNPNASFAEILNSTTDLANLDTSAGDIPQEFTEAIQAASQEAAASQNDVGLTASAAEIISASQPVDIAPTSAVVPPTRTINPWQEMDPAILNELPEEVRREVYASVLDNVRRETTTAVDSTTLDPIDDEFLNALPANIRREVTAAHERVTSDLSERAARVGVQAAAAQSATGTGNSGDGNIEDWIRTLPQDLRRTILTDMAEENVAALPEDLQTEARNLQQRTLRGMNALESYRRRTIRPSNFTGRANYLGRYDNRRGPDSDTRTTEKKTIPHLSPKYMIDAESLSCILAVLFVNDNGIQQRKLHMILKNFAMHGSTCNWLINSLLDIIHRTTNTSSSSQETSYIVPNWLSLKLEASLGVRHSVFQIKNEQLEIHPQAASYICRSVLDSLTYLAKWNSKFFNATSNQSTVPSFWDLLLKLEKNSSSSNFGKKADPQCQLHVSDNEVKVVKNLEQLNKSVFASLLRMLSHPVINESKSLLDKTLSLISIVAIDLPVITGDQGKILKDEISNLVSVLGRVSSEEGTQECTNILLEMSRCHVSFRIQVLDELIAGASTLGKKLEEQLRKLSSELKNRTKSEQDDSKKNELTVPAMQKLTSKNSAQASFLRLLKIIEELRRSDFGASSGTARGLNWRENGQRGGRTRDGRGHSWLYRMRGMQMPGRFQFDETLNDVIHAAISRNRPDTAETIIDVMERQLSGRGGIQDVLLPRFMRDGAASDRASSSRSGAASSQRASTSEAEDKKDAESVKESDKLKKEAASLNDPLADLLNLTELWQILSESLGELDVNKDSQTFMVLQPAVEAFFMVHASSSEKESDKKETKQEMLSHIEKIAPLPETHSDEKEDESSTDQNKFKNMPQNTIKFLQFAEKHKAVLNQILRQSSTPLVDGPFAVLTKHIRLLDFDIKRRYFRKELEKIKENTPRGDTAIHVNRETIFDDSFRELHRKKPEDWKGKLYIVFNNEEGQDAGGLLREWFLVISRQMFNPNYALFAQAANDRVTYRINPYSDVNPTDKLYFNFVGHVVAKAILDNKLLECYFTRAFYKHMLGVTVTYKDMEAEDLELYRSLLFLINNPVADLGYEITFSMDFERFGKTETIDLKENGRNFPVTDENKLEYVHLICQEKMVGSVKNQLRAFLEGFYDIIPRRLISIFDEHELELLISGLPTIDIDDLKANTEYQKYNAGSLQIQWFWRALKSFNQEERAKFLQFVTGTSKVPLRGFANLEGMNGTQKFQIHRDERSTSRLPCAHTCFNQLDLPVYETYEKLRTQMLKAITESSEGFGLA